MSIAPGLEDEIVKGGSKWLSCEPEESPFLNTAPASAFTTVDSLYEDYTARFICQIDSPNDGRFPDVIYFNGQQYEPVKNAEHVQAGVPPSAEAATGSADTSPQ